MTQPGLEPGNSHQGAIISGTSKPCDWSGYATGPQWLGKKGKLKITITTCNRDKAAF